MEYVGEQVSVVASFGGKERVRPVKFRWAHRVVQITEVTYRWTDRQGQSKVYHFCVTDGSTIYELSFNATSIVWKLDKVETNT
ncbi:MAG: hypothetical protein HQL06_15980 [Nitrospirae bacterium]|nr:hypothetical protein [Nitrospirota bacterium]